MSGADAGRVAWDADVAVEELYAAHFRRLVRLSVLLVRDVETAEEVVQDAFVAMHGRWRSLRDPDKALAYLRQSRGQPVALGDPAAGGRGPARARGGARTGRRRPGRRRGGAA